MSAITQARAISQVSALPRGIAVVIKLFFAAAITVTANIGIIALIFHNKTDHILPELAEEVITLNAVDIDMEDISEVSESHETSPTPTPQPEQAATSPSLPNLELSPISISKTALKLPTVTGTAQIALESKMPPVAHPIPAVAPLVKSVPKSSNSTGAMLIEPPDLSAYYPYSARRHGTTGTSTIILVVDTRGKVVRVDVLSSSPASIFDMAAIRIGKSLSFRPACRNGIAVQSRFRLVLNWKLN